MRPEEVSRFAKMPFMKAAAVLKDLHTRLYDELSEDERDALLVGCLLAKSKAAERKGDSPEERMEIIQKENLRMKEMLGIAEEPTKAPRRTKPPGATSPGRDKPGKTPDFF